MNSTVRGSRYHCICYNDQFRTGLWFLQARMWAFIPEDNQAVHSEGLAFGLMWSAWMWHFADLPFLHRRRGSLCLRPQNSSSEDLDDTFYSETDYIVWMVQPKAEAYSMNLNDASSYLTNASEVAPRPATILSCTIYWASPIPLKMLSLISTVHWNILQRVSRAWDSVQKCWPATPEIWPKL